MYAKIKKTYVKVVT